MGAHTLGKCTKTNSGYSGPWITGKGTSSFDNAYYKQMIDSTLTYAAKVCMLVAITIKK